MVPSSFMISQITPEGVMTGQARDIHRRLGMPGADQEHRPRGARRGKTWPGVAIVAFGFRAFGSMATATVRARSWAEIPVVTRLRVLRSRR